MAENAAHLTTNLTSKPSIFEVVASDSLLSTFYPAFKRIANFLVLRNPERFTLLGRYYDEIFLACNGLIQNHYLKNHGGSLSEVFYGLTRLGIRSNAFSSREHRWSLLTLVLLPYVHAKLSSLITRYEEELQTQVNVENRSGKQLLIRAFKYLTAFHEFWKLIQYLRYLTKRTPSHLPVLQLTGMYLSYADEDSAPQWSWSEVFRGKIKAATFLSGLALSALESSAFVLQFLQWWQTEAETSDLTHLPVPEAPELDGTSETFLGICPICLQNWNTPTACSLSGYVYCYKCILKTTESEGRCPVSNYEITMDDLIRIYEN